MKILYSRIFRESTKATKLISLAFKANFFNFLQIHWDKTKWFCIFTRSNKIKFEYFCIVQFNLLLSK